MGMADDAVDVLAELIKPGVADAIRLKAVENILNRSGIRDAVEMNVTVTTNVSASEEINKKLAMMRERLTPAEPEEDEEILEAEEVIDAEEV